MVTDVMWPPRAVVFDLDGTLTDNMGWHTQAFTAFLARHGLPPMTMALRRRIDGKRNDEIFPILFDRPLSTSDVRAFEHEKESLYRELSKGQLLPLAGTVALLDRLEAAHVPIAVATSAPAPNVAHTLAEIGLINRVPLIARGDEVPRGKPFPDVFLRAAVLLGVSAGACLAFEDAPLGVTAAKAAGMTCVALTTSFSRAELGESERPPDAMFADFEEFLGALPSAS